VSRRDDQLSQAGGTVGYLPLTPDEPAAGNGAGGDRSIGALVKDATTHMSTLIRAEVELAKAELVGEVKKGVKGSVLFIIALTVALYSSFFFFFFLAELLAEWLPRWAAFAIVFGLMLVFAALCAFLGFQRVRKIKAPERTIDSVKQTAAALRPKSSESAGSSELTTG